MNLHNRTILVTGGAKRLGKAIALELGRRGAWVAVHYHASTAGAEEVANALEGGGKAYRADLRSVAAAETLVDAVLADRGSLDGLVLNAADFFPTPFGTVTEEEWDRVFSLNLKVPFFLAQQAAPALKAAKGAVVLLSDVSARNPWADYLPYCLTKAGVSALARGLAKVLAPDVRVNAVAPGPVLPPDDRTADERRRLAASTLLNRLGRPEDVSAAVRWFLETDFVTGQVLDVDGGQGINRDRG